MAKKKKVKSDLAAFQEAARARGLTYAQAQVEETAASVKRQMDRNIAKVKERIAREKRGDQWKCKRD